MMQGYKWFVRSQGSLMSPFIKTGIKCGVWNRAKYRYMAGCGNILGAQNKFGFFVFSDKKDALNYFECAKQYLLNWYSFGDLVLVKVKCAGLVLDKPMIFSESGKSVFRCMLVNRIKVED